ncbi:rhodanese-like domain-containing protein [Salimicrobium jeotgali]|uniref:Rhodanese domain-containing protein n=1 Tax=Salimicrobium jeotgali TaxID=1230341 RepID=K2GDE4_9BACI|nr:rhodanese-like domain-containing protein [Salimicrobium jeotgali]AKG04322.1 rhodanese-like domain-containing protein [Salimicrobium jeotgali]EKE32297.1 rhodanese domain-containing protein [Salimicrobium jeotgali]MBM7695910.1 rhodanese-related sulfurtransferase [Salimicrobium jeotgali]
MSWWILLGIVIIFIAFSVYRYMKSKKILTTLSEDEFKQEYRKAQLIDVREPKEFDSGHILGARNIPLSQMRNRTAEIRQDKPVYLYCQSGARSTRAAMLLHKKGYKDLNQLEGGFKKWNGKIKAKK